MGTTIKLFKLQIDEMYSVFKISNLKKLLFSVGKYVLILAVLLLGVYFAALRLRYYGFEVDIHVVAIVLLFTQLIALLFAVGNIINNLFNSSNSEILFTLPASANEIFLSKILVIYVREVIVNSSYTLPLLVALGIVGKFSAGYYLCVFPLMLLLPLLPLSIAAVLSLPVNKLIKLFKKRPIIATILMAVTVITVLFLYIKGLSAMSDLDFGNKPIESVDRVEASIRSLGSKTFIFLYLADGIMNISKIYFMLIYAGIGIVLFIAAAFLIRPFFFKTALDSREASGGKTYKNAKFRSDSPLASLVKKEFLTGFRSPGYVFQYFIFALIMPIVVVLFDELLLSLQIVTQTGKMLIAGSHVLIVCMFAMLSNIVSASAISREGGNFYIVKTSPVSYYVQTGAKLLFNSLFSMTAITVTCVVSLCTTAQSSSISAGVIIVTSVVALFASLGHMCLSFDMDLRNPTLNWYDSGDVTTVSSNTTKSLIFAVVLSVAMSVIILVSYGSILGWTLLVVLSIVLFIRQAYVLMLRVSFQYERQEM